MFDFIKLLAGFFANIFIAFQSHPVLFNGFSVSVMDIILALFVVGFICFTFLKGAKS